MFKVFKDKELRNKIFKLMIPFMLQELVVVLTTALNTILLGFAGEGEVTLTGVGYVFQIFFLFNTIICAIIFVGNLFVAQHYGANKLDQVKKDFHLCLKLAMIVSIIFFLITITIPDKLVAIFAKENELVIAQGAKYLKFFSITFIPTGISMVNYLLLKNVGLEKYSSLSSIVTFLVTLMFDLIFLFGCKGVMDPVVGAALSLLIARIIEMILCIILTSLKSPIKFSVKELFIWDAKRTKSYFRYGTPMFIGKISWSIGLITVSICIGMIAVNQSELNFITTANQLMLTAENLAMCINTGMSTAIGVVIGRELGSNNIKKAKDDASDLTIFIFLEGVVNMSVFLALMPIVPYINNGVSQETWDYLFKFFLIQSAMFIPRAYNAAYENGVLNAGGDQLFVSLVDGLPWWIIILPLGFLGVYLKWDPVVIFTILQLEEIVKCPANCLRYRSKKWARNVIKQKKELFNA